MYVTDVFDDAPRDVTSPFRTSALVKQGPGLVIGQSGHPPWRYRVLCVYPIPGPPPLQPTSSCSVCCMTARPPHSVATAGDQPDCSLAGDLCPRPSRSLSTHHSPPQPKPPLFLSLSLSHLIIIIISSFPFFSFSSSSLLPLPSSHLISFNTPPPPLHPPSFFSLSFFFFFFFLFS